MTSAYEVDGLKVARARLALPPENGRHISQTRLAEIAGCHSVTISNIERGKYRNLSTDLLGRLADALRKPMEQLLVERSGSAPDVVGAAEDLADALRAFAAHVHGFGRPAVAA